MKSIVVIGAGFSGAVVVARLLQQTPAQATHIYLINGSGRIARGMAYGTQSPDHTLNVPAGNMSALEDDPGHFLRYAQAIDGAITPGSFVSRNMYGDYMEWLLDQAQSSTPGRAGLTRVDCLVTRIEATETGHGYNVALDDGTAVAADQVVLALGHFPSSHPRIADQAFYGSQRYIRDPWDMSRMGAIPASAPVLLLGTGLTAIDVAMTLLDRDPSRRITAVSRRGLLPQHHRHAASKHGDGGAAAIWGRAATVRAQLRAFRRYCAGLAANGRDWREAMAMLRPVTAQLWLAYSDKERRRFLRHVQPYWDTHRHRLAPSVHDKFDAACAAGIVRTVAGRVRALEETEDGVTAIIEPRGMREKLSLHAAYVINCTGPCADPRHSGDALVDQLLADGMIRPDKLGLGIDVAENCAVVDAAGNASSGLYYIGPWLKANYWEATAVPDLRRYAQRLACTLLEGRDQQPAAGARARPVERHVPA